MIGSNPFSRVAGSIRRSYEGPLSFYFFFFLLFFLLLFFCGTAGTFPVDWLIRSVVAGRFYDSPAGFGFHSRRVSIFFSFSFFFWSPPS